MSTTGHNPHQAATPQSIQHSNKTKAVWVCVKSDDAIVYPSWIQVQQKEIEYE